MRSILFVELKIIRKSSVGSREIGVIVVVEVGDDSVEWRWWN